MKDLLDKIWAKLHSYSREEIQANIPLLVKILTTAGRSIGISGILRHYKWREVAMADILGHAVHSKTSTGTGGDATDKQGRLTEYKTGKTSTEGFGKQLRRGRLRFGMVYNGAYGQARIRPYATIEHYFGLFDEATEECFLIYHADSTFVVNTLMANDGNRVSGATTNLNIVSFDIETSDPRIIYWSTHAKTMKADSATADAS